MMTSNDIAAMLGDEAFALVREPGDEYIELILQRDATLHTDPSYRTEGFYWVPFDTERHPVTVIPDRASHSIKFRLSDIQIHSRPAELQTLGGTTAEAHRERVEQIRRQIAEGKVRKVVLAGYEDLEADWDPVATFLYLTRQYPDSYVFYVSHPEVGSMLGATPELFFEYDNNFGLTYSLAGTKFHERDWTAKEKDEQKIVTDYIIKKLLAWQLVLSQDGPYDHRQGHLTHLRTDIRFILNDPAKDIPRIMRGLHPTPAVAGMPKKEAVDIIRRIEDFDRGYYTGFLGRKGAERGTFYVNLRSLAFDGNRIRLMAGGGITLDSDPQAEWNEIRQKMEIMRKALRQ
ncbi:MAG: chorismate-binding protein [Chlorobi bacterium]|nr:chorismate-binding protein [Chlorobiota bacterium]